MYGRHQNQYLLLFNDPATTEIYTLSLHDTLPISITLAANDTVTCTFTDTKRGQIVVDKVTSPSGDRTRFSFNTTATGYGSFTLTDAATPNGQTLSPGAYSVSEAVPAGWVLTGLSCASFFF